MKSNAGIVIKRLQEKLKQKVSELPEIIGNEGQRAFADEFKNQRWDNNKWKEVKRRMPGTFEYKYPKRKGLSRRTNPILVGRTRRLKELLKHLIKKETQINWFGLFMAKLANMQQFIILVKKECHSVNLWGLITE